MVLLLLEKVTTANKDYSPLNWHQKTKWKLSSCSTFSGFNPTGVLSGCSLRQRTKWIHPLPFLLLPTHPVTPCKEKMGFSREEKVLDRPWGPTKEAAYIRGGEGWERTPAIAADVAGLHPTVHKNTCNFHLTTVISKSSSNTCTTGILHISYRLSCKLTIILSSRNKRPHFTTRNLRCKGLKFTVWD